MPPFVRFRPMLLAALGLFASALAAPAEGPTFDKATLKRVKRATVYLQVKAAGGAVYEGSGFLAEEPGLVVTNAHVLGMLEPNSRKPLEVEVVVNSGETDSKTYRGVVLGVDRGHDLGVLRIQGKDLPPPLKLGTAEDLIETQEVYIFGFPFGKRLGKNITVSKSSVSSLRKSPTGALAQVQVNGGMHPGNSGGPVTDAGGQVVGVAVAVIKDTQINFAIPGEQVRVFLGGRPDTVVRNTAYHDGDRIKLPVQVHFIDPLGRVEKAALELWIGPPGASRPPSVTEPHPAPGDLEKQTFPLVYDKKTETAEGEVVLPPLPDPKQVYWIRPVITLSTGRTEWAAAFGRPMGMLVRRDSLKLAYRPPEQTTFAELTSRAAMRLRTENGEESSLKSNFIVGLREQPAAEAPEGGGRRYRLTLHRLTAGILVDDKPVKGDATSNKMFTDVMRNLAFDVEMDSDGNQAHATADVNRVPRDSQGGCALLSDQVLQSLGILAVPLPGDTVKPLQTWKTQRLLEVGPMMLALPAQADLRYTYLGVREQAGRKEAIIAVVGRLRGQRGNAGNLSGSVQGTLMVAPETGQVVNANAVIKLDVDVLFHKRPAKANGELAVSLKRGNKPLAPPRPPGPPRPPLKKG